MKFLISKVQVTFIDDTTGESLGTAQMPAGDLPEGFGVDSTVHIGDDEWSIVDAAPMTRAEYTKTKALTLRLRRIEKILLSDILYSLPSICDVIPALGEQKLLGNEFLLAEDDWRQFEFVSNQLADEVDDEIAKIVLIHKQAASEVGWRGWRDIHIRSKPNVPLVCDLTLAELAQSLNITEELRGVTYHGAPAQIADGYAFATNDGLSIYGLASGGKVLAIAFGELSNASPSAATLAQLKFLAHTLNLDLVYWCRCARIAPSDPLFDSLFV